MRTFSSKRHVMIRRARAIVRGCGALLVLLLVFGSADAYAQIQTSVPSLSGFIQTDATPCPPQSYVVSGTNLTADVVITAPTGFEISLNQSSWVAPPSSITIGQNGPTTIPSTTIYVRLNTVTLGSYSGSIDHSSTDSPSLGLPVSGTRSAKSPTSATLLSNLNPSVFGQTVMLTTQVSSPLPGTPTGSVTFYDGVTSLGTTAIDLSASASLSTAALSFGAHSLSVTYSGDGIFDGCTSPVVGQSVQGTSTSVVASNNNPSVSGESVTLTATVTSPFPGTLTGSVTFYDGVSSLGSAALSGGAAAISTSGLAPGSHPVTATYSGDVTFAGSTSPVLHQMVKALTTTTLSSNHNPSVTGQLVTLTANVGSTTPGTITGTVTFLDGVSPIGSPVLLAAGSASVAAAFAASAGGHSFTAVFNGDANYAGSTSLPVAQTVNKAGTAVHISAAPNPSSVGESVTISATVTPVAPGSGTPAGSVIFTIDGVPSSPISTSAGVASIATSSLALGIHTVTGSYSGDGDFDPITSSVYADSVDPVITATAGPHGSISPSGAVLAPYGGNQSFVITPAVGYDVDSLVIDGVAQAGAGSYTFTNVTANHTIHPTFLLRTYDVTITSGPHGLATPTGVVAVLRADSLVVSFAPDAHYHVADILLDGVSVGPAPGYVLRNVLATHTIAVSFAIDTFMIVATAGAHGTITPSGSVGVPYGGDQRFTFTPEAHYAVGAIVIDGVPSGPDTAYTFTGVSAPHTIDVSFGLSAVYGARYRTFVYDSLIVKKAVAKKPVTQYWEFTLHNTGTTDVTELNVLFATDVKEILFVDGPFSGVGAKKAWRFAGGTLHPGDSLVVKGRSMKAKPQLVAKLYLGPVSRTVAAKAVPPERQWSELPMPNTASVRDLAFAQAGFATQPWIIGVDKSTPDSGKFYGWVALKKSADMYKSLYAKGQHTVVGKGFDLLGTRPFLKKQSSLPPTKQNNKTFADLLTLKFNILLSQLGITQRGFGELRVSVPASPYDGFLVREIAAECDSMMTYHDEYAGRPELYGSMDSMLVALNGAFSAPMDTASWSDSLRLTGTAQLEERPFLEPSEVPPALLAPRPGSELAAEEDLPERMRLDQNYPNPFNPTTTIGFSLPDAQVVTLSVYNVVGQQVTVLVDHELFGAGENEVTFDAGRLASGVYLYRLVAVSQADAGAVSVLSRKMVLMK